jgi:hypothetical protein
VESNYPFSSTVQPLSRFDTVESVYNFVPDIHVLVDTIEPNIAVSIVTAESNSFASLSVWSGTPLPHCHCGVKFLCLMSLRSRTPLPHCQCTVKLCGPVYARESITTTSLTPQGHFLWPHRQVQSRTGWAQLHCRVQLHGLNDSSKPKPPASLTMRS